MYRYRFPTFVLLSAQALAAELGYIGIWASDTKGCADPSDVFQVTNKTMRGKEWGCNTKNLSPEGDGRLASLACASEGVEYNLTSHWQIAPNGHFQETVKAYRPSKRGDTQACEGQAGHSAEYVRCKAGTKSPWFRN
jgi:hypothetical protein